MSKKKKPAAGIQPAKREFIKGFDAKRLAAPFVLRCGAMVIDYIVILLVPVTSLLLGKFFQFEGAKLLNNVVMNTGWLITILVILTNFLIFPMFSGQSIGKMLTGIRIVNLDGSTPGITVILIRNLIGYPITLFSGMIGFLLSAFNKQGRSLHDYIGSTVVVYGKQKRSVISSVNDRNVKKIGQRRSAGVAHL